jgi:hypothetical protein
MTPAAIIPMHTPERRSGAECSRQLGTRMRCEPDGPAGRRRAMSRAGSGAVWKDVIGLDGEYDYDPV